MNNPLISDAILNAFAAGVGATPFDSLDDEFELSVLPNRVAELMPSVLRIQSLERVLNADQLIHNRAVLFHECCTMSVDWITQHVDTRLHRFGLVTIRHASNVVSADGSIRIQRLLPANQARANENLFETILPEWVKDRELVARAGLLWEALPKPLAHLLNAVLWESGRFHRFVMGPSSLQGHHHGWNGNFRHSVEVAEHAREIGQRTPLANTGLLIAGALLHDVAKADEYRFDRGQSRFRLSERGELIGHRDTLIEWLAVARATGRVILPDDLYLGLLHMINAVKGAPAWLGLREPRCLEAEILSMADRLSGHEELHSRCAPQDGESGFGGYHPHIGRRTYVTPREMA